MRTEIIHSKLADRPTKVLNLKSMKLNSRIKITTFSCKFRLITIVLKTGNCNDNTEKSSQNKWLASWSKKSVKAAIVLIIRSNNCGAAVLIYANEEIGRLK